MKKVYIKFQDFFALCCYLRQIQLSLARHNHKEREKFNTFITTIEPPSIYISILTKYLGREPVFMKDVKITPILDIDITRWLDIQINLLFKKYFIYENDLNHIIILLKKYEEELKDESIANDRYMNYFRVDLEEYAWYYFYQLPKRYQNKVLSVLYYYSPNNYKTITELLEEIK